MSSPLPLTQPLCRLPAALLPVWLCAPAAGYAALQRLARLCVVAPTLFAPASMAWAVFCQTEHLVSLQLRVFCAHSSVHSRLWTQAAPGSTTLLAEAILQA